MNHARCPIIVRTMAFALLAVLSVSILGAIAAPSASAVTRWSIRQLTENDTVDRHVSIEDEHVAWAGTDSAGGGDTDIFLRDLSDATTINLSNNDVFEDLRPTIDSGYVAWDMNETPGVGDPAIPIIQIMLHSLWSGETTQLTTDDAWLHLSENRDGHVIYYGPTPGADRNVFYFDADSGLTTQISAGTQQQTDGSSDGLWAVWESHQSYLAFPYLMQYNFVTEQRQPLFPGAAFNDAAPRVRNGWVAFVRRTAGQWDAYVMNLSTRRVTRITDSAGVDNYIYAFEGDRILYGDFDSPYDGAPQTGDLYIYNVTTHTNTKITDTSLTNAYDFTMKDDLMVWIRQTEAGNPASAQLFVYNLATDELQQLTHSLRPVVGCTTDGTRVAWCAETGSGGTASQEIFVATPLGFPIPFFVDVLPIHPYYDAIQDLRARGLFGGYAVGLNWEFRSQDSLLRAQFAKMLCGAFDLDVSEGLGFSPFTDLGPDNPENLYPHEYVAAARAAGITNGTTATTFAPWEDVSRAQVVTMIVRATQQLKPHLLGVPPIGYTGSLPAFSDVHGRNMILAEYNGLLDGLQGFSGTWDPWAKATRGETAQILWNLLLQPK